MRFIALLIIVSTLSGCAAPLLLGVKSYKSGDTHIEFVTGADIGFSANGINNVNNQRGIK